jgi:glycosyltransferase involved in cell wall biosynthesis
MPACVRPGWRRAPMKLLLLTRQFRPEQAPLPTWSCEMARRLAPRCEQFALLDLGATAAELAGGPARFDRPGVRTGSSPCVSMAQWGLAASRVRRFDVVLGADWLSAALGLAWRGRSSVQHVFAVVHGPELEREQPGTLDPWGRLYRRSCELALRRCDGVFATSARSDALLARLDVQRRDLIGQGCDEQRFQPAPRSALERDLGLSNRRVLLGVGPLLPERRIDKVLFALSALGVRYPDLCCVLVGEGPERERLALLAERLRISHKVRFLGRVGPSVLPAVYTLCDVYVHLRAGSGYGPEDASALLAALSSGRPAILTAGLAADEGIDATMACIVPEDDSMALGEALTTLLDRPMDAAALGQRGRAHVLASSTWDGAAERLLAAVSRVARGVRSERATREAQRRGLRGVGSALVER